jgi:hypothetical protein
VNNDGTRYFVTFSIRFAAVRRCCVLGPIEFPNALLPCCTRERDLVLIQHSPHQPLLDNLNQQQVCARHADEKKQEGAGSGTKPSGPASGVNGSATATKTLCRPVYRCCSQQSSSA